MNGELSYNGKTLSQMSKKELEKQYETNKKRLAARTGFLGGVGVLACFVMPVLAVGPLAEGNKLKLSVFYCIIVTRISKLSFKCKLFYSSKISKINKTYF